MPHKKRINTPKFWPINRKIAKYIVRPIPGPHKLDACLPITIVIRDILKHVKTTREVKTIINEKKLFTNNLVIKDHHFPIGLMDTISLPTLNEHYKVLFDQNSNFKLKQITKDEASLRVLKILNKTKLKKNRTQLNFFNGSNLLVEKDTYKVGDTLLIDAQNQIKKHLRFDKGAQIYLSGGKYIGYEGTLETIIPSNGVKPSQIKFKHGDKSYLTLKEYAFVIEK